MNRANVSGVETTSSSRARRRAFEQVAWWSSYFRITMAAGGGSSIGQQARRQHDDVVHAVEHEMVSFDLEPDADPPKVLVIGPDSAENLLEVIVLVLADDRTIAIHAMKLRRHFYELLPRKEGSP